MTYIPLVVADRRRGGRVSCAHVLRGMGRAGGRSAGREGQLRGGVLQRKAG